MKENIKLSNQRNSEGEPEGRPHGMVEVILAIVRRGVF